MFCDVIKMFILFMQDNWCTW